MSRRKIIILAVMAVADLCVLGLGAAILLTRSRGAPPVPTQAAIAIAASFTPTPISLALPNTETPTPTDTRWATWTPRATRTPFGTRTPTVTQTPTKTPTRTLTASRTPRMSATPRPPTGGGSGGPGGGSGGGSTGPGNVIRCGTPNGRPTNGKLDVLIAVIGWRDSPTDRDRTIGTLEILPSGGNDCYKYNFIGKNYDYEPIEFEMGKCGCQTAELVVTSRDGQRVVKTWSLCADDPAFKCQ